MFPNAGMAEPVRSDPECDSECEKEGGKYLQSSAKSLLRPTGSRETALRHLNGYNVWNFTSRKSGNGLP